MLRPYRLLAAVPHAPTVMICGLLGRLYHPAVPIVTTFLIADWTDAYVTGGVIGAAQLVGQAIAGPLRGRAADRTLALPLLLTTSVVHAAGLIALALTARPEVLPPSAWWSLIPVAFVTGVFQPPVGPMTRAIWPRLAEGPAREAAYAVDSTLVELLFIVAPILAALAVGSWGPSVATVLCALAAVLGSALFASALVRAGLNRPMTHGEQRGSAGAVLLREPGLARVLLLGALLVMGLVMTDLVLIGWARERGAPELAGMLAAVWAAGSMVGGLVAGASNGTPRLWLRTLLAAFGMLALAPALPPFVETGSAWWVGAILFAGGMAIAPTMAACSSLIADIAPAQRRTEAFGWFNSTIALGATAASPVAGGLLDVSGPGAAAVMSGVIVLAAAILATHRTLRNPPRTPVSPAETAEFGASPDPRGAGGKEDTVPS